jgi:hypothetical protein
MEASHKERYGNFDLNAAARERRTERNYRLSAQLRLSAAQLRQPGPASTVGTLTAHRDAMTGLPVPAVFFHPQVTTFPPPHLKLKSFQHT